jgi:gentisate 1,2-dioxygenase
MTDTMHDSDELTALNAQLSENNMTGQWTFEPMLKSVIGGPAPRGKGFVWPRELTRPWLAEASRILGPAGVGRCNLTFRNPGLPPGSPGSTHTLAAGVQVMRAHEVCWSHRHSMSALRFILEGNSQAYTAVDGEALTMEPFDLLITPRFSWHDHHNPTGEEVVWLDVLDIGLTMAVNQAFYEEFGEASQPLRKEYQDTQLIRQKMLRPAWEKGRKSRLPVRYPWADVLRVLESYGDDAGDPYDGLALAYANPVDGGPTMTTMDCWIQQLVPGFEGKRHRRTSSSVGYVITGRVRIEVGDDVLHAGEGDTFAIPNYAWHRLANESGEPARIFSVHDIPAITSLGLFYEEPVPTVHAHAAPAVPGVPHKPAYRTDALLDEDEER